TTDRPRRIGLTNAAATLHTHQATDSVPAPDADPHQPHIAQGGARSAEQAHVIPIGSLDNKSLNHMPQAVKDAGEGVAAAVAKGRKARAVVAVVAVPTRRGAGVDVVAQHVAA